MSNSGDASNQDDLVASGTRFDEFLVLMKRFRNLAVVALGVGGAPYVAYLAKVLPPWPPGIAAITALVELVCLVLVFQFMHGSGRATNNRIIAVGALVLGLTGLLYLLLFASFTYEIPSDRSRDVAGFLCRQDVPRAVLEECPFVSIERLADAEYSGELIWQLWTIYAMRVAIALTWLGLFISLSLLIGTFILFQSRPHHRRRLTSSSLAP
jgi:hypothetical protein